MSRALHPHSGNSSPTQATYTVDTAHGIGAYHREFQSIDRVLVCNYCKVCSNFTLAGATVGSLDWFRPIIAISPLREWENIDTKLPNLHASQAENCPSTTVIENCLNGVSFQQARGWRRRREPWSDSSKCRCRYTYGNWRAPRRWPPRRRWSLLRIRRWSPRRILRSGCNM